MLDVDSEGGTDSEMRRVLVAEGLLTCLLLIPGGAISAPMRTVGTVQLRATFADTFYEDACPPGVPLPSQKECFSFAGKSVVPGLGKATVTWMLIDDLSDGLSCQHFSFTTIVVNVANKGEIDASLTD